MSWAREALEADKHQAAKRAEQAFYSTEALNQLNNEELNARVKQVWDKKKDTVKVFFASLNEEILLRLNDTNLTAVFYPDSHRRSFQFRYYTTGIYEPAFNLPEVTVKSLTAEKLIQKVKGKALEYLTATQAKLCTSSQKRSLFPQALIENILNMTPVDTDLLQEIGIARFSSAQIDRCFEHLSDNQKMGLCKEQISKLKNSAVLQQLTKTQVSYVPKDSFSKLTDKQLRYLSNDQIEQISGKDEVCSRLSPEQIQQMAANHIKDLPAAQIVHVSQQQIYALFNRCTSSPDANWYNRQPKEVIQKLPPQTFAHLTEANLKLLTQEQVQLVIDRERALKKNVISTISCALSPYNLPDEVLRHVRKADQDLLNDQQRSYLNPRHPSPGTTDTDTDMGPDFVIVNEKDATPPVTQKVVQTETPIKSLPWVEIALGTTCVASVALAMTGTFALVLRTSSMPHLMRAIVHKIGFGGRLSFALVGTAGTVGSLYALHRRRLSQQKTA